ncbi:hypothetical protein HRI_005208600 [Hibiscus trionum]|uniref:Uncharacterized protein n=1 Tax=Hibiscus trionum TaxID=183268 RepID=A0A9W7JKR0_HIBTR|nr:hypothetical protein HRI_005208600 [Hibiscus trionum]
MELRSTSHLHFVNAIKGGSVEKSMNVGFRGRPELKFKGIKEIYNLRDTVYHNQVPAIYLRDDLDNSPTKCFGVKVERSDFSLVGGIKIKIEPETFDSNCKSDGDERIHDLDDLGFGNMTLKQIKKRCKKRKRKCSIFVGLNKETMETCSSEKHELPNILHEDGECDLEEPLINLKSKLSKKIKCKKTSRKNVSALAPNAMSLTKSKQVHCDEDLMQPNEHLLALVEVEVPEPGYSECQTIFSVTSVSDFSCSKQVHSTVTVSNDVAEVPNPTNEPQYDSLNEVSCEYSRNLELKSDMRVSSWDIVKVDSPEIATYEYSDLLEFKKKNYIAYPLSYDVSSESMSLTKDSNNYSLIEVPESAIACGLETSSTLYPVEDPLCSVSNGVSCEYLEDVIPKFGAGSSGWEIVKVDSPEMISYHCSGLQELGQERYAVCALPYDISPESMPPTKDCSADLNSFKSHSSEHEMAWQTSSHDRTEAPEMGSDDSLQCLENINEGSACSNESSGAGWPLNSGISPSSDDGLYWSSSCLNPVRKSVPVSGHSPSAGKQSHSVATDDDASDKPMTSPGHPDFHQRMQQQQHSERLPSSRKTISPTSQERLCRAMELTGLDEDGHQQCRGKLYFGKQTNHRILRAQGLDQFGRDGATIKPKPFMRKVKQDKRGSPTKGILKVTHLSGSVPQVSSSCTTAQRCSQSAIAFTQRQMRDIESLATKLTTELKSMKDIVMGKLHSELEASAATVIKENANEVRIAVESATKAEETARKWLSMMARDCNRFCKIMKSTEDTTAASERVIQKERKITFADEAGGKLCHVKIFKDDMGAASSLQCGTEETELRVE